MTLYAGKAYSIASAITCEGRVRVNIAAPKSAFVALALTMIFVVGSSGAEGSDPEEYDLFVSIDEAKVCIISGNFSVAITRDWPRVIFKHEEDPFSPTFEVSCPRMYVHNDTNGDGLFTLSETALTVFLDSNHVSWNLTDIDQGYSHELGEYATFGMRSELNAYSVGENETLVMASWARLSFWYSISEKSVDHENSLGRYTVDGGTQLRVNFSLSIDSCTDMNALVLEQFLQGGGSTNMFHLMESEGDYVYVTEISATVDERVDGEDFSHGYAATSEPVQEINFAKEDGSVQALYRWGSEALVDIGVNTSALPLNSSYFTTGNGMMLHSQIAVDNCTTQVSHESIIGLVESGFVGSVTDWMREYSWPMALLICVIACLAVLSLLRWRRRRQMNGSGEDKQTDPLS